MKSESEVAQSCPTLSDPTDCSLPGSSIHGIFQARVLECGATAFSVRWDDYTSTVGYTAFDILLGQLIGHFEFNLRERDQDWGTYF